MNERALRYVFKDKTKPYRELLQKIGIESILKCRRIQDMLNIINRCLKGREFPPSPPPPPT